jgi:stearoyl-CoA desaturase (delta-9 desaturase)
MTTTTIPTPAQPHESNSIQWPSLIWIGGLHLAALCALNPAWFTWDALLLCVALHWLTGGVGICMTYHRLLTHRSFSLRPAWLEYPLTLIGCLASEGGPIGWVADHRKHHAYSDQEGDVHSPKDGFGWSHMFWWMTPDVTSHHTDEYYQRWAPDLFKDPVLRFLDRTHVLWILGFFGLLYAWGGMPYLVWGGFLRTVLVLHSTWLVNSASHVWGYKTHATRDDSRNNWWVAALTYGEGWHNNHHAFQTSARHGMAWWEVDTTYWLIRAMSFVGIAYNLKFPKFLKEGKRTAPLPSESVPIEMPKPAATRTIPAVIEPLCESIDASAASGLANVPV